MVIAGWQKLTLLDYPGKIACTVFTAGCNFRCPFCQNAEIIDGSVDDEISEEEVLALLESRKGKLKGVCISGGEPTMQKDLLDFCEKVKALGYFIKIDSNGSRPDVLRKAIEKGLCDYVAMDIKNAIETYDKASGTSEFNSKVEETAKLLINSGIDYEFRTTVVDNIHTKEDIIAIGKWLKGESKYFLQRFRESETVPDKALREPSTEKMQQLLSAVKPYLPNAELRGV